MNIIFDLDGTLIDSSERMYCLFQELVPESEFTKEQYWDLKRDKINHRMILKRYFPEYQFDDFNKKWLNFIERDNYLEMDCNYPDTREVLQYLSHKGRIVLLTARQSKEGLYRELERLDLVSFFSHILVTEHKQSKIELIKAVNLGIEEDDYFISDMGNDILEGNTLGYKTVGISHGFMNKEKLMEYNPDYLIDELSELKKLIK